MFSPEGVSDQGSPPVDMQRAVCILGNSDTVPAQSQEQRGFSQPQFPQERCRLPFLFTMTSLCPETSVALYYSGLTNGRQFAPLHA